MAIDQYDDTMAWATYVYGWYQDFLPLHIFSVLYSYPHHYVRIFLREKLSEHNQKMLNLVRRFSNRFEVNERHYPEMQGDCMSYRWLMPEGCFYPFKYAYNCDVDIIVYNVRRRTSILTWHHKDAQKLKLPFSNRIWRTEGKNHLWGCHFTVVEPYFAAVQPVLNRLRKSKEIVKLSLAARTASERVLYEIVAEAFKLPPLDEPYPPLDEPCVACPGLHLSSLRWGEPLPKYVFRAEHLLAILGVMDHPVATYIVERTPGRAGELLRNTWRQVQESWMAQRLQVVTHPLKKEGW